VFSELQDWINAHLDNYDFVQDFFGGTGSTNRFYTDGDRLVEFLKTSNGIRLGLKKYKSDGCPDGPYFFGFGTPQGYLYAAFLGGALNPAEFQIGGFDRATITKVDAKTVRIHMKNRASYRSLWGQGVASSWSNTGAGWVETIINTGTGWVNALLPSWIPDIPQLDIPTWEPWPDYNREDGSGRPATIYQTFDFTMPNPCCKL